MTALVGYFKRDARRTRCPECGRYLVRTTSGQRLCAYAENHRSGVPLYEQAADQPEEAENAR